MRLARRRAATRSVAAIGILIGLLVAVGGRLAGDSGAADRLLAEARELYRTEGPGPAYPAYEQALAAFRAAGDERGEAVTLGLMGNCHKRFGEYDEALRLLRQALSMKRALGDRQEEGATLNHLGLVHWELGDYKVALERFEESSEIAQEVGDAELEGANLNNESLVYDEMGEYERALAQYQQALDLYAELDFPRGLSDTLGNMGGVHLLLGRYRQACELYERSLAIGEREGFKYSMSVDRGNLALCKLGLGHVEQALADFDAALALTREVGATQDEAYWLAGKGEALVVAGRYDEGLELMRRSVERYDEMESRGERVEALHDLGALYSRLGDPASAEKAFRQAVELAREIDHARGVTLNLLALGDLEWQRGHEEQALALVGEALRRAREAGQEGLVSAGLLRLAAMHRRLDLLDEASAEATEALEIGRSIEAPGVEAEALYLLGDVARSRSAADAALALFEQAEEGARQVGDPDLLWRLEHARGLALAAAGRSDEAVAALSEAVKIIESVRSRLREERFRAGYLQDKHQVYVDLVRLLLDRGETEAGFGVAERLRAHGYLELVSRRPPPLRSDSQRQAETELRQRIRGLQRAIDDEREKPGVAYRQRAVDLFSHELIEAETEYQTFLDDLRRADPEAPVRRAISVASVGEIQAGIPAGAMLVEYVVSDEGLIVFGLTGERLRSRVIGVGADDLQARVALLRDLVRQPETDDWRRPASRLARLVLQPLAEAGWLEGIEHLYLVPHGPLHYLPFGLLPMGGSDERLLVEAVDLTIVPAAATLAQAPTARQVSSSLLALAPASSGLVHTPSEVRRVSDLFPPRPRVLIGEGALESAFKSLAPDYRLVHIASHGHFNKLHPMLSGLELEADEADDGRLQVHEILEMRLDADLVVLSACDTGLSSGHLTEIPTGDDFVGLTRAFIHAGSRAVVSTLWQVNDRSTVEFMQGFYRRIASPAESGDLASALAAAQRAALRHPRYGHPYYWAPFVLVGTNPAARDLLAENDGPRS